jgi:hypothetical protein
MASTLKRTSRSMPAMPMADSSAPMVVGISVTNSATSIMTGTDCRRHRRKTRDRRCREHEDQRQAGEEDVERDLVRRLLPLGALDQRDHAVEEGRARAAVIRTRIQSDSTCVPPVTAERSPPDSRITGADSPVIAASLTEATPFDHLAVGGDDVAGLDQHDVADLEAGAGHQLVTWSAPAAISLASVSVRARSDSACALPRPSATASAKLANSTVNHSQMTSWKREAEIAGAGDDVRRSAAPW